jgi:hypothetical protein
MRRSPDLELSLPLETVTMFHLFLRQALAILPPLEIRQDLVAAAPLFPN